MRNDRGTRSDEGFSQPSPAKQAASTIPWLLGGPLPPGPPPDDDDFVEIVPFSSPAAADTAFEEWLGRHNFKRADVAKDLRIDQGRGHGGVDVRRYRIRRGSGGDPGAEQS